jgi:SpoVK/Ycf46/Vps4 family AAA+-type ATPase
VTRHRENALIGKVFLRLLEYYTGVMILTTNRTASIDEAFESRIDVTLTYSNLGEADRGKIWRNFLQSQRTVNQVNGQSYLDDDDIDTLAQRELNGRQIKSAVKMALLLAARKREPLDMHHFETVLEIRDKARSVLRGHS